MTNIVNVGYHSTNYYALDVKGGRLLVDCGWPNSLPQFTAQMKRKGIAISEIKYLLATHFHPDHAGLVEEFKGLGARLILLENQLAALQPEALKSASGIPTFVRVSERNNILLTFAESRQFLASLELPGEILPTPGHTDDSIALILDEGCAFTGDLPPRFILSADDALTQSSWDRIYQHNITQIFPAHGQ
jgi:endoribonuclease LACTB2